MRRIVITPLISGAAVPATCSAVAALQAGCNALEGFKPGSTGYMSGAVVGPNTWLALVSHCYTPAF
jgi:hypothetical protein